MTRRNPRARSSSLGTLQAGILGVLPFDPEIIGVYPSISASFLPHKQEISFHRGDTLNIPIQIQDDQDPPDPVMISGGVLRWSAKQNGPALPADNNVALLIKKTSYDGGIELTNEANGQAILHVYPEDTRSFPVVAACWDLEVTQAVEELLVASGCDTVPAPTASVTVGTPVVTVSGYDLMSLGLRWGDIIDVQGRCVLVKEVLSSSMVETDFDGWTSESDMDFVIARGETKTVASGPFSLILDITI